MHGVQDAGARKFVIVAAASRVFRVGRLVVFTTGTVTGVVVLDLNCCLFAGAIGLKIIFGGGVDAVAGVAFEASSFTLIDEACGGLVAAAGAGAGAGAGAIFTSCIPAGGCGRIFFRREEDFFNKEGKFCTFRVLIFLLFAVAH